MKKNLLALLLLTAMNIYSEEAQPVEETTVSEEINPQNYMDQLKNSYAELNSLKATMTVLLAAMLAEIQTIPTRNIDFGAWNNLQTFEKEKYQESYEETDEYLEEDAEEAEQE